MGDEHRAHEHGFRDKLGVRDLGQLLPQMRGEVNRYGAAGWLLVLHVLTLCVHCTHCKHYFHLSSKKRLNPTRKPTVIRNSSLCQQQTPRFWRQLQNPSEPLTRPLGFFLSRSPKGAVSGHPNREPCHEFDPKPEPVAMKCDQMPASRP